MTPSTTSTASTIRTFQVFPDVPDAAAAAAGAGQEPLVGLAPRRRRAVPPARPQAVGRGLPQPGQAARDDRAGEARRRRRRTRGTSPTCSASTPRSSTTSTSKGWFHEATTATGRSCWSPTSRPSSACTSRCRSTPAAWASSPAITSRAPANSACRWSASGCSTATATSSSTCPADGWQQEAYPELDFYNLAVEPMPLRRRHARAGARRPAGQRRLLQRLEGQRRPHPALPARHQPPGERARPTATSPPGCTAAGTEMRIKQEIVLGIGGVRALDGAERQADRLPHERRARARSSRWSASACCWSSSPNLTFDEARQQVMATQRLHDAHAGAGRHRLVPAGADAQVLQELRSRSSSSTRKASSRSAAKT